MFQINAKKTSKTRKTALFLTLAASLGLFLFVQVRSQALDIINRVNGYILLQVESYGEAWYVIPTEGERIYLQNGDIAYQVMRNFSLGITNANLAKIPIGIEDRFQCLDSDNDGLCDKLEEAIGTDPFDPDTDGDGYLDGEEIRAGYNPLNPEPIRMVFDYALANRLKGRILLQVESRGQAWYVNPRDGKRYYMPDGQAAYQIMRYLSLGISNADLNRVPIFNSSSLPSSPLPSSPPTPDTQAPTAPVNLTATASGNQISLTWTASTDNVGVSQYRIERSLSASTGFSEIAFSNSSSFINTGLDSDTTYYYRVRAVDVAGNFSPYSNITSARTTQATVDTQAPTAPGNLMAIGGSGQISLNWTAATDNVGVVQYRIERSLSASTGFSQIATSNTTSYNNTGLSTNTTYYYRVRAVDVAGNLSPYSNVASSTTASIAPPPDTQAPTAPGSLAALPTDNQISLTWIASTDNVGVVQYRIERSMSASSGFSQIDTTSSVSYINTGLSANTTYYYRVRAVDVAGNLSPYSNVASAIIYGDTVSSVVGEDYSLPAWVEYSPYTGYVQHPQVTQLLEGAQWVGSGGGQRYRRLNWNEIETSKDVYDFSTLESLLDTYRVRGHQLQLQIWSNSYGYYNPPPPPASDYVKVVPDYIFDDDPITGMGEYALNPTVYHPAENPTGDLIRQGPGTGDTPSAILAAAIWQPAIAERFNTMLVHLGQWLNNPEHPERMETIGSAYLHALSYSMGEEMTIFWWDLGGGHGTPKDAMEARGLTAQRLEDWLKDRIDVYADIFGDDVWKVAWLGGSYGSSFAGEHGQKFPILRQYAWDKGMGNRKGNIERYHYLTNDPSFGASLTEEGYVLIDEDHPSIANIRYYGDENEEYGQNWADRFGPHPSHMPHRYRFSLLSSLRFRHRWIWTGPGAEGGVQGGQQVEAINLPLSAYWRLSAGKTIDDTPDAWAYLIEAQTDESHGSYGGMPSGLSEYWIKNMERWLVQRDVPGGMTVPTNRLDREFWNPSGSTGVGLYDYTARRTDIASNNNYIYFDLDDRFLVGNQVQIKVELVDNSLTSWHLDYYNSSGALISTPTINNLNDGQTKTYTITINNPNFANQLSGLDFRLVNEGPGDITVRWVRVLRYF